MKRFLMILTLLMVFSFSAFAENYKTGDYGEIRVNLPSTYTIITQDDIDKQSADLNFSPVPQTTLLDMFQDGMILQGLNKDKKSEVRAKVTADDLSKQIKNLSPLSDGEQQHVLNTTVNYLKAQPDTTVLESHIAKYNGHSYIFTTLRIGSMEKGYCYTNMMTIVGSKTYELTIFHSMPILSEAVIKENEEIFKSFKIYVMTSEKSDKSSLINSILSILGIIVAIIVIIYILITFYKDFKKMKEEPERVYYNNKK